MVSIRKVQLPGLDGDCLMWARQEKLISTAPQQDSHSALEYWACQGRSLQ